MVLVVRRPWGAMAARPGQWMSLGVLALALGSAAPPLGFLPGAGLLAWGCIRLRDRSRAFDGVLAGLVAFLAASSWGPARLPLLAAAVLFALLAQAAWSVAPARLAARVVRASGWVAAAGLLLAWFLSSWFAREVLGADGGLWGFLLLALGLTGAAAGLWWLDGAEPVRGPMPELPPA